MFFEFIKTILWGNAERKEFRRSRLFKVTGRLIGMLMIEGGEEGRGSIF